MAGVLLQHQHDWEWLGVKDNQPRDIFLYRCRLCKQDTQVSGYDSPSREECDVAIVRNIHES